MSSILKSLKKLEEEKAGQKQGSSNVSRDILKGDVPKRKSKSGPSWVVMVLLAAFVAGAVLFLRSPEPPQVAETTPAVGSAPVLPPANQAQTAGSQDSAPALTTAQDVVSASKAPEEELNTPPTVAVQDTVKDQETVVVAPAAAKPKKVSKPAAKPAAAPVKEVVASEPEKKIDLAAAFPAPPPKIKPVPLPAEARTSVWSLANQKGSTKPVLKVSEIRWRNDVRERLAVVNDLPVMEGVVIDGAKVDRIFKDRIRFVVNGQYQEVLVSAQR